MFLHLARESPSALSLHPFNLTLSQINPCSEQKESERRMRRLRERGIYALPDGREFVVHASFAVDTLSILLNHGTLSVAVTHSSCMRLAVTLHGQLASWGADDLSDTTLTAGPRSVRDPTSELPGQFRQKTDQRPA
jgi:hypothetical protein